MSLSSLVDVISWTSPAPNQLLYNYKSYLIVPTRMVQAVRALLFTLVCSLKEMASEAYLENCSATCVSTF